MSTGDEASRFARFAFRRHFFQHAGFRLARTIRGGEEKVQIPARIVDSEVFVLGVGVEGMLQALLFEKNTTLYKLLFY